MITIFDYIFLKFTIMNPEAVWAVGDFLEMLLTPFDWYFIWDMVNMLVVLGGFVGMLIWLRMQGKYNKKAEEEGGIM